MCGISRFDRIWPAGAFGCFLKIYPLPDEYDVFLEDRQLAFVIDLRENPTYAFRYGSGVHAFKLMVGPHKILEDFLPETPPPVRFELAQNFPNPFNSATAIQFSVPEQKFITLEIVDIQGAVVRRLEQAVFDRGRYLTIWDGRNEAGAVVASGVYFAVLRFENSQYLMRKMIMLR